MPRSRAQLVACTLLAVAGGTALGFAQELSIYRSSVGLTRIKVAVFADSGIAARGLGVEDFAVREGGVDREVQVVLSPEDNALDVVLALDFSQSVAEEWPDARESAHDFLDSLSVNDCVYLLPFNSRVGPGVWGGPDNPELRRTVDVFPLGGATRLYDSMVRSYRLLEYRALSLSDDPLFRTADELDPWPAVGPCSRRAAERSGERRRAIVLLTDGADFGSNTRYADILQTSWHAEVPVFPVAVGMAGISGARWRIQRSARGRRTTPEVSRYADSIEELRAQLNEMARITGGQMVSQRDIRRGYDDVLGLLRGYYVVGYRGEEATEGWSEVEVSVRDDDLDVVVQPGVYRFSQSVQPALDALRRGRALFARGDYEEALAEFDIAVALERDVGAPFYGRGLVLEALESWEEARDSYLAALQWDPGSPAAHGRLADVSLHLGDYSASWEYAIRARLSGVDVRGVMALLSERGDAPDDLAERLASPVVAVLSPQVPSLTALLDTRDLMHQIVTRIDDSPNFGYATRERFADVVLSARIATHERRDSGTARAEIVLELYEAERGKVREEKLTIENLDDGEAAAAALTTTLEPLLEWVTENVEPRERASDEDRAP